MMLNMSAVNRIYKKIYRQEALKSGIVQKQFPVLPLDGSGDTKEETAFLPLLY
jgi:hypothetical protein